MGVDLAQDNNLKYLVTIKKKKKNLVISMLQKVL